MNFEIYYHLPSSDKFLSNDNAKIDPNLDNLKSHLQMLGSEDDCVYIYIPELANRIRFSLENDSIVFEIHDSSVAGIYTKIFPMKDLDEMISLIPNAIRKPEKLGFIYEHW